MGNPIFAVLKLFFGETPATIIINLTIGLLLIFTAYSKGSGKLFIPILIYFAVGMLITWTIIIHPEYEPWYIHDTYGILHAFVDLRSGITALLIFRLYDNKDDLLNDLKIAAIFVLVAYSGKFLAAMRRGYWIVSSIDGTQRQEPYNMDFGYRILFPAAFFGADGFLNKKRGEIILFAICTMMILVGGSRGPALWAFFIIPLVLVYQYPKFSLRKKQFIICGGMLMCIVLSVGAMSREAISQLLLNTTQQLGIESRTINAIMTGTMMDGNGRDVIYGMAIELIKTGGLWGHGFYGDRTYIGQRFRWGYSHNIVLEAFVQFGYIGGAIFVAVLVFCIIRLSRRCKDVKSQTIFITVIICSMRLLVSNSFWYEPWFWAAIALMLSRWQNKPSTHYLQ